MVKVGWTASSMDNGQGSRRAVLDFAPRPPQHSVGRLVGKMISLKQVKNNAVYNVLKAAWSAYGSVKMSDLEGEVMAFDFESQADRDRVFDMSPWSIHGHCLNLKVCPPNRCIGEVDFGRIQMWIQIHDLSLEMLSLENAKHAASSIGICLEIDSETEMHKRGYIRMRVEVVVNVPLSAGFWWRDNSGKERWAHVKYERLSDLCYGCGTLGHNAQSCNLDIALSEVNTSKPKYGPWMACSRQRKMSKWGMIGGGPNNSLPKRDPNRKTWKDLMREEGTEQVKRVKVIRDPKKELALSVREAERVEEVQMVRPPMGFPLPPAPPNNTNGAPHVDLNLALTVSQTLTSFPCPLPFPDLNLTPDEDTLDVPHAQHPQPDDLIPPETIPQLSQPALPYIPETPSFPNHNLVEAAPVFPRPAYPSPHPTTITSLPLCLNPNLIQSDPSTTESHIIQGCAPSDQKSLTFSAKGPRKGLVLPRKQKQSDKARVPMEASTSLRKKRKMSDQGPNVGNPKGENLRVLPDGADRVGASALGGKTVL